MASTARLIRGGLVMSIRDGQRTADNGHMKDGIILRWHL